MVVTGAEFSNLLLHNGIHKRSKTEKKEQKNNIQKQFKNKTNKKTGASQR